MYKLKTILFGLLTVTALTIFLTSCEKEQLKEANLHTSENIESSGLVNHQPDSSIEFPELNDDVFKFKDVEQFEKIFEQLNSLYDQDDQKFNKTVKEMGINSVYNKLTNDEFVNPEDRYQPFLADPIMMSIANEHFEFQIEESLFSHINNEFVLISDIKDINTRKEIKRISKGPSLNLKTLPKKCKLIRIADINDLPKSLKKIEYWLDETNFDQNLKNSCTADPAQKNTGWGWRQSGSEAISMRTSYYKNFWSSYEEAKVYGYTWNGSSWKKQNSSLVVTINATRRNNSCTPFDIESETKSCHSCKDKRARVNSGISGEHNFVNHCDGDVTGSYLKAMSGILVSHFESIDFSCQ